MKVIEHLANATTSARSVGLVRRDGAATSSGSTPAVESLMPYEPPFIDITSHAAETVWDETPDGTWKRRVTRKAPGTFGLCATIEHRFDIDPVPHVLCNGFTREETEDALIELHYLGIENVLAIRGDGERRGRRSPDRQRQRSSWSGSRRDERGEYLEDLEEATPTDFCLGVACYPEKHEEAPNLERDIAFLMEKQRPARSTR